MSSAFYRSPEWRRLRAVVLQRDPVCATRGCGRPSSHVDHIVPRSRGGADTPGNLRGVCVSCHNRRSASGNAPLRAIGFDVNGQPLDPAHPWLSWGETSAPEKSLGVGGGDRAGSRIRTKFPRR